MCPRQRRNKKDWARKTNDRKKYQSKVERNWRILWIFSAEKSELRNHPIIRRRVLIQRSVHIRCTEAKEEKDEPVNEKRRNEKRERGRTERNNGISEKSKQEYGGELKKDEGRNDGRHKSGKCKHKRIFNKRDIQIKELERKEKHWQIEKKIMQVPIEMLEDKVMALESKFEDKKIETQIRSEVKKRMNEDDFEIPKIQKEEMATKTGKKVGKNGKNERQRRYKSIRID
ncbi:hypothetical protein K0M31_012854 [Melipona bicolor]|uniref:Uncharacterized protein n=1 Tax=Melipona bicolor TaxID=60889 RepID=A0AA40FJT7_9HYME|nr:hypothetical protein K0M31_012854 [Melipona bicolor]